RRFARAWTMIAAESATPAEVLDALRSGESYVVVRTSDEPVSTSMTPALSAATIDGARLTVALDGPPSTITFIGQDGRMLFSAMGTTASYELAAADTYVRT